MLAEDRGEIKKICDVTSQMCRNVRHTATVNFCTVPCHTCQQEEYIIRRWGIPDLVDISISYRNWDFSLLPSVVLEEGVLMWNKTTFTYVLPNSNTCQQCTSRDNISGSR
jgi:hypothetical protein